MTIFEQMFKYCHSYIKGDCYDRTIKLFNRPLANYA